MTANLVAWKNRKKCILFTCPAAGSLKSVLLDQDVDRAELLPEAPGEIHSLLFWLLVAASIHWFLTISLWFKSPCSCGAFSSVCLSHLPFIRIHVIVLTDHQVIQVNLTSKSLILSHQAKTFFCFTPGHSYIFWGHYSAFFTTCIHNGLIGYFFPST